MSKVKTKNVRSMLRHYMLDYDIESFGELAKQTGIKYQTLTDHIKEPGLFRKYEIQAIDDVLHFSDDDLVFLIRG